VIFIKNNNKMGQWKNKTQKKMLRLNVIMIALFASINFKFCVGHDLDDDVEGKV
jgi:hypothetical protein